MMAIGKAGSDKVVAIEMIERMSDDVSLTDIAYSLYVRDQIERGLADADAGRTVTRDELDAEIQSWLRSSRPPINRTRVSRR